MTEGKRNSWIEKRENKPDGLRKLYGVYSLCRHIEQIV